jgi:hypothetical protein
MYIKQNTPPEARASAVKLPADAKIHAAREWAAIAGRGALCRRVTLANAAGRKPSRPRAYRRREDSNRSPCSTPTSEIEATNTAPRYTAKYTYAAEQMLYASAAKGFRIGGTNSYLPPICNSSLAALGLTNGQSFQSDSLWSYEVGSKNSFDGDRITRPTSQ